MGIGAFGWLFGFGMVFGVVSALLFLPQPDLALEQNGSRGGFLQSDPADVRQRALYDGDGLRGALVHAVHRGALLPHLHAARPGDAVSGGGAGERGGYRLPAGLLAVLGPRGGPLWVPAGARRLHGGDLRLAPDLGLGQSAQMVYAVVLPFNLMAGLAAAGISVALSTLTYKVTPSAGRSTQFAVYSIIVVLAVAPMPTLGGYLPT